MTQSVLVVDLFIRRERPTKHLGHHMAVFSNQNVVYIDFNVAMMSLLASIKPFSASLGDWRFRVTMLAPAVIVIEAPAT